MIAKIRIVGLVDGRFYRYGIGKAPLSMAEAIEDRCSQAVKRYLETPY